MNARLLPFLGFVLVFTLLGFGIYWSQRHDPRARHPLRPGRRCQRCRRHHHHQHDGGERAMALEDELEHVPDGQQLHERAGSGDGHVPLQPDASHPRHDYADADQQDR
jgi:hypothetical protein